MLRIDYIKPRNKIKIFMYSKYKQIVAAFKYYLKITSEICHFREKYFSVHYHKTTISKNYIVKELTLFVHYLIL